MKYNPKYKVLFACPLPPTWYKLNGYVSVGNEYNLGSFQVTAQFVKKLEICYTYDSQNKYDKLVKLFSEPPKNEVRISEELWEILTRRVKMPTRRKKNE